MKNFLLTFLSTAIAIISFAQNGELPPVTFPANTTICDNTTWKLVFQDDFNGNKLGSPWLTWNTYLGSIEDDNWSGARCSPADLAIIRDKNVVVSNGTVKLKMRKESDSWICDTCYPYQLYQRSYTKGLIHIPFSKGFNSGSFEARVKFPTFKFAHCAFWLWHGKAFDPTDTNSRGVNEIDIAEGYGHRKDYLRCFGPKNFSNVTNSTHAWEMGITPASNPYNMTHKEASTRYPGQEWYNCVRGNNLKIDEFHTYIGEWDTTLINFYLDGILINQIYKYYRPETIYQGNYVFNIKIPSFCNVNGLYRVNNAFPYNNNSFSSLIFGTGIDTTSVKHQYGFLGEMEVDYVKVWQRQIENGWTPLCEPAPYVASILGPKTVCSTATFNAVPPAPSGWWPSPSSITSFVNNISILSSNNTTANVQKIGGPTAAGPGYLFYLSTSTVCPTGAKLVGKEIMVGKPVNVQTVAVETHKNTIFGDFIKYYLGAGVGLTNDYNTYEWDVDFGTTVSQHYHSFGQYVSTPFVPYDPQLTSSILWTLKASNECGTVIKTGQMTFNKLRKTPTSESDTDALNIYAIADIPDFDIFQRDVENIVSQKFVEETDDSVRIHSMISKTYLDELAPYLLYDSSDIDILNNSRPSDPNLDVNSSTLFYPNPANNFLNFTLAESYVSNEIVTLKIYDLIGKLHLEKQILYTTGNILSIDISSLPFGIYTLQVNQNQKVEHFKISKKE